MIPQASPFTRKMRRRVSGEAVTSTPAERNVHRRWKVRGGVAAVMIVAVFAASGQTFESVSIKGSPPHHQYQNPDDPYVHVPVCAVGKNPSDPTRMTYTNCTLISIVSIAFKLPLGQIAGPQWIRENRYDIIAKLPAAASQDQISGMVRNLLSERFHMITHMDAGPQVVYVLTVGEGGSKLNEAKDSEEPAHKIGADTIQAIAYPMSSFANLLASAIDRPVVDLTQLRGHYDITLDVKAGRQPSADLFKAIQGLGLELEPRNVPGDHLVVDKAEKTPTVN
jgi:uncharacterized protein (TIGR03435 family)